MGELMLIPPEKPGVVIHAADRFRRRLPAAEADMGDEDERRLAVLLNGNAGDCRPCDTEAPRDEP